VFGNDLQRRGGIHGSGAHLAVAHDDWEAVRRPPSAHPQHRQPPVVVRGRVFIGGYFYDPVFGRYPWWPPTTYPYRYLPVYDHRADLRLHVTPKDASVYVDGFYAGIVDDFDGIFEGLPLTPGGHAIELFLEGYRTTRHNIYLRPGSTFKLRDTLHPLAAGERSAAPSMATPPPAPPEGSYTVPRTPPRIPVQPQPGPNGPAADVGTLDLVVQPRAAAVRIDGQPWLSSEPGHFVIQISSGRHTVEVTAAGHRTFSTDVDIRPGDPVPINVSLMPIAP
jgi:hypothetical protein